MAKVEKLCLEINHFPMTLTSKDYWHKGSARSEKIYRSAKCINSFQWKYEMECKKIERPLGVDKHACTIKFGNNKITRKQTSIGH